MSNAIVCGRRIVRVSWRILRIIMMAAAALGPIPPPPPPRPTTVQLEVADPRRKALDEE